jgi:hypothetical protein
MALDTVASAPEKTKHLPRFHRASQDERPVFRLTDRDREMLKIIYEYRFITAGMLQDLASPPKLSDRQRAALAKLKELVAAKKAAAAGPETAAGTQRTQRKILRRLQMLYHAGYVQRKKLSDNEPIAYAIGNAGAGELMLHYGIDRQQIDWTTKNREAGEHYIRHALMVSRFRHAIELAVRLLPGASVSWKPPFKEKVQYEDTLRGKTQLVDGAVIPDGLFIVTGGKNPIHYFLEADRSTMTNARYLAKLKSYFAYYAVSVNDNKSSDIHQMRVLTITRSEERKKNLRDIAQNVHATMAKELFWFACERSYLSVPEQVVAPIWQTLKDESFREL